MSTVAFSSSSSSTFGAGVGAGVVVVEPPLLVPLLPLVELVPLPPVALAAAGPVGTDAALNVRSVRVIPEPAQGVPSFIVR